MVEAHVKEGDSVDLDRWLRLGGERRGEDAESKRGRERRAYDHHAATCRLSTATIFRQPSILRNLIER
jgi:hypothetical protein